MHVHLQYLALLGDVTFRERTDLRIHDVLQMSLHVLRQRGVRCSDKQMIPSPGEILLDSTEPIEDGHLLFRKEFELILHGSMTHHVSLGTDARGNITRIDNALSGITEKLEKTQEKLAVTLQQVEDAKAEAAKAFPQEQELREKSARLAELDAILNMDGGGESMEEPESEYRDADAASDVGMLSEESVNYGICDPKAGNARPSVLDELRSKSARIPVCKSGRYTEEVL